MIRSLLVILIPLVILAALFTDLPDDKPVTEVDWRPVLAVASRDAPFPVLAPTAVPEGWRATQADWVEVGDPFRDGQPSVRNLWQLGFLTSDNIFIGLDQGDLQADDLVEEQSRQGTPDGESTVERANLGAADQLRRPDPVPGAARAGRDHDRLRRPGVRGPGGVRVHFGSGLT